MEDSIKKSKKHHTSADGRRCKLTRIKTYEIEPILNFMRNNPLNPNTRPWNYTKDPNAFFVDEEGNKCKLRRARVFLDVGTDCLKCGAKAKFFALEKWPDNSFHFELYAIDKSGDEVLMTIDHVLAKINGGQNTVENYAPLCKVCNELKGRLQAEEFYVSLPNERGENNI